MIIPCFSAARPDCGEAPREYKCLNFRRLAHEFEVELTVCFSFIGVGLAPKETIDGRAQRMELPVESTVKLRLHLD